MSPVGLSDTTLKQPTIYPSSHGGIQSALTGDIARWKRTCGWERSVSLAGFGRVRHPFAFH